MRNGACGAAFIDAPLLEGLGGRQGVLGVHGGIAEVEVQLAVEVLRGGLGDDLHLSAARIVVTRGVGILVDLHFLHGRGGDGDAVCLNAIDDEAAAAGCGDVGVKESTHGGDKVVIEDGQRLEVVGGHDRRVVIFVGGGELLICIGTYHDVGRGGGDGKHDMQRRSQSSRLGSEGSRARSGDRDFRTDGLESCGRGYQGVCARHWE